MKMTKSRTQLIQEVIRNLEDAGFDLSSQCDVRPSCFDLVARRGQELILVKVLTNIGALTEVDAITLQLVAHFFNATPLVVGERSNRGPLVSGVVYKRYGVSTIAPMSFRRMVSEQEMPREFIQRGGRFVAIDGERLRAARVAHGLSKEDLAQCVQVSTRAILAYERDRMDVSSDVAHQLEEVLETDLIIPIELMTGGVPLDSLQQPDRSEHITDLERRVNEFFERLGMTVLWTDRAPFHVAAKEEGPPVISGVGSLRSVSLQRRVRILRSVSDVTESEAVLIVEDGIAEESIDELPVIRQVELEEIEEKRELKKIIKERSTQ
jgi:putative transcriptional regulator